MITMNVIELKAVVAYASSSSTTTINDSFSSHKGISKGSVG
jgi:hypothetical protein